MYNESSKQFKGLPTMNQGQIQEQVRLALHPPASEVGWRKLLPIS
jgi:hypothetical protein